MRNNARTITRNEWIEIYQLPAVGKVFDIRSYENVTDFATRIYGAKYTYDNTDYPDTTYTLVGNYGKGEVMMLQRTNGILKPLSIE
jgi:hypothetical protein